MSTYEFILITNGVDLNDTSHVDALLAGGCDDAIPFERDGVTMLSFAREADRADFALRSAVNDVEGAIDGARVVGLSPDLVSTSDIAMRTGRSRESVRLLAEGKRGSRDFPRPVGWVGDRIRVWRWADVAVWLRAHGLLDDDVCEIDEQTAAWFNGTLAQHRREVAQSVG